ncbi:hypothetical protein DL98DRAFT_579761 [Cadophora sp. DSE1049]|nr:hypothetical protein DL98DRAFT_579761 [Cadophora sp. DSE1049]
MSYEPGIGDKSNTAVSESSNIAFYFKQRLIGSVQPSAESIYNWDPLQAIETSKPTTPKDFPVELSQIAFYFADRSHESIQPSDTSIQDALELRIAELSNELETSQKVASEWKARALSYHTMKVDWDLAYVALHQSMQKDLVEIEGDVGHLANSISYLNEYEKKTHEGVQVEVAKFMSLIKPELRTTEQVSEVSTKSAACIRRIALLIGPLLMEFNKMVGENIRTTCNENASAAERKRVLNVIVNRDISTVLIHDLNSLKREILGFFNRNGLQKLRTKPHEIVKHNDLEQKLACIKIRLAIYTGQYEEVISQIIERHQTEIIQKFDLSRSGTSSPLRHQTSSHPNYSVHQTTQSHQDVPSRVQDQSLWSQTGRSANVWGGKAQEGGGPKTEGNCERENCELELKIYNHDLKELEEFECEEPTISHCPVDEDCHECFVAAEKGILAEELEKEARKLVAKIILTSPTSSHAFNKSFREPVIPSIQSLDEDLGDLHLWYFDNVVKHHQLQLKIAILKGDEDAIKSCKALMDERATDFENALDAKLEAAKIEIINKVRGAHEEGGGDERGSSQILSDRFFGSSAK